MITEWINTLEVVLESLLILLLQVMYLREDTRRQDGRVEVDDAYLGGERSGGKPGRGSENKVPFVATVLRRSAVAARSARSGRGRRSGRRAA